MFLSHYGMSEQPFGVTPDARFLYMSASHREALASLLYGIQTGRGFIALIAAPGMGKTTLLFQLMEQLRETTRTVFLFQAQRSASELLANIISDLGLEPKRDNLSDLQSQLNDVLIREVQSGRRVVLVIDEAQKLRAEVLESVRMLSNFETQHCKLLQIVLAGQPQLADKLTRPDLTQLRQRVSVICHLELLNPQDVSRYIENRLAIAGYKGGPLFTPDAMALIIHRSAGIPRNINNICFHALSLGYAKNQKKIDLPVVQEVLEDLDLELLKAENRDQARERWAQENAAQDFPPIGGIPWRPPSQADSYPWSSAVPSWSRDEFSSSRKRRHGLAWTFVLLVMMAGGSLAWALMGGNPLSALSALPLAHGLFKSTTSPMSKTATEQNAGTQSNETVKAQGENSPQPSGTPDNPRAGDSSASGVNQPGVAEAPSHPEGTTRASEAGVAQDRPPGKAGAALSSLTSQQLWQADGTALTPHKEDVADSSRSSEAPGQGELYLESNIPKSRVYIDGKSEPDWLTPHTFMLQAGTYWISVEKLGRSPWTQAVHVSKGRTQWFVANLDRPSAVVEIETTPSGLPVYIDGSAYGPSPVEGTLVAGEHKYMVIPRDGSRSYSGTFSLKADGILRIRVKWPTTTGQPSSGRTFGRSRN